MRRHVWHEEQLLKRPGPVVAANTAGSPARARTSHIGDTSSMAVLNPATLTRWVMGCRCSQQREEAIDPTRERRERARTPARRISYAWRRIYVNARELRVPALPNLLDACEILDQEGVNGLIEADGLAPEARQREHEQHESIGHRPRWCDVRRQVDPVA